MIEYVLNLIAAFTWGMVIFVIVAAFIATLVSIAVAMSDNKATTHRKRGS